jgi:hypothetical protein
MKMPKFIQDDLTIEYKKRLKEFQQVINPKQAPEIIEQLRRKLIEKRGN